MRKPATVISGLLVLALAGTASAAPLRNVSSADRARSACADRAEPTRTLDVKVRVLDDEYRLGQKAKFRVRVHRMVEGEDLGPVAGAVVGVGVTLGQVFLSNGAMTDSQGRASVDVALKRHAPTGLADVSAWASKSVAPVDPPCHSPYEYEFGGVQEPALFRVVR